MTPRPRRFWIEAALCALSAFLLLLTLINDEWIETVFGVEPDGGSGALEWGLFIGLAALTVGAGAAAWADWRRAVPAEG